VDNATIYIIRTLHYIYDLFSQTTSKKSSSEFKHKETCITRILASRTSGSVYDKIQISRTRAVH